MTKELIIVIFGSTGDLTSRKLLPAIQKLYTLKTISNQMSIIACGRRILDTKSYLEHVYDQNPNQVDVEKLSKLITYFSMDFLQIDGYIELAKDIKDLSNEKTRVLFYLAIGPDLFTDVVKFMAESQLIQKNNLYQSIIFEKPFGYDLESAKKINAFLWQHVDEKQIYRIDHYLGKEMIQNIMMVRFANRIFEEIWHNRSIKSVKIIAKETDGILNRAGYYDQSGALRDMVQSHLLQMLSLIAMEVPITYQSEDVKNEKVDVLKQISFDPNAMIFGQYEGYLQEMNIPIDSKTETFVCIKAKIDSPRFKGVPFYLITGKKLNQKETVIVIEFEETNEQRKWNLPLSKNQLIIKIAPLDGVALKLNSKVPGLRDDVEQVELEYCIACNAVGNMSEAYEKLFLDAINYHKTLFARWDEIEYAWRFIDAVKKQTPNLMIYHDETAIKQQIKDIFKEDLL